MVGNRKYHVDQRKLVSNQYLWQEKTYSSSKLHCSNPSKDFSWSTSTQSISEVNGGKSLNLSDKSEKQFQFNDSQYSEYGDEVGMGGRAQNMILLPTHKDKF